MDQNRVMLNKFTEGVNTDIAEDLIPNNLLSNGHNIKFTNHDNKQGIVQKQEAYIRQLDGYDSNLIPLAAQVYNDVIYIVSYRPQDEGNPIAYVEIGTFPSADLAALPGPTENQTRQKVYKYAPLPNYKYTPYAAPTGSFSSESISGVNDSEHLVTITYAPGTEGTNWVIEKISGNAIADFIPASSSLSGVEVSVTINGSDADTATYQLRDIVTSVVLDTVTIAIANTLGVATITSITDVLYESMVVNANIADDGGEPSGVRGVCWNTTGTPTIADDYDTNGTGEGAFSVTMLSLSDNQIYYIRSFYTNSKGTSYSTEENETTLSYGLPTLTTGTPYGITDVSITVPGAVIADGGYTITEVGAVYSELDDPVIGGPSCIKVVGSLVGDIITANLTSLDPATLYYIKAYAITSYGTGYGNQVTATTLSGAVQPPSGYFSNNWLEGGSGQYFDITVTYDAGDTGTYYNIVKAYGSADAYFFPDEGTTGANPTSVTITGTPADTARYNLIDETSSEILDILDVVITEELPL